MKYLCRSINRQRNPYPEYLNRLPNGMWMSPSLRKKPDYGLLGSTPYGRRVAKKGR